MDYIIGLLGVAGELATVPAAVAPAVEQGLDMQIALITGAAGLVGALLGALIPTIFTHYQAKRSREDERGYLAVHVSSALYSYASGCVDVAYDTGEPDDQGRQCIIVRSPTLDPLSLDVNWRSISVAILDRIFALSSAQGIVNSRLGWEAENDFEYPILERQIEYGRLAIKALGIAQELRRMADLPPDPEGSIDLLAQMKKHVPELEAKLADIQRRNQESWAKLDSTKPLPD
jgi:hypothetical protein